MSVNSINFPEIHKASFENTSVRTCAYIDKLRQLCPLIYTLKADQYRVKFTKKGASSLPSAAGVTFLGDAGTCCWNCIFRKNNNRKKMAVKFYRVKFLKGFSRANGTICMGEGVVTV